MVRVYPVPASESFPSQRLPFEPTDVAARTVARQAVSGSPAITTPIPSTSTGRQTKVKPMGNIRLEKGDLNFLFIVRKVSRIKEEREQSLSIQTDRDYPGTA